MFVFVLVVVIVFFCCVFVITRMVRRLFLIFLRFKFLVDVRVRENNGLEFGYVLLYLYGWDDICNRDGEYMKFYSNEFNFMLS